jgi:hypothetical protein
MFLDNISNKQVGTAAPDSDGKTGMAIMKLKVFGTALAMALAVSTGSAQAETMFAQQVDWTGGSIGWDGTDPLSSSTSRTNPNNALGGPADGRFLSLGLGGMAVFDFGVMFDTNSTVFEVTWGNVADYPESLNIYTSTSYSLDSFYGDGSNWTLQRSLTNLAAQGGGAVSLTGGPWRYVLLKDTSPIVSGRDGFDVDAISVSPVPLPPGLLMLLSGLLGLGFLARGRSARSV